MDPARAFQEALAALDTMPLRHRPAADELVRTTSRLATCFEALPTKARQCAGSIPQHTGAKLLSLSGYLSEAAINLNDDALVRQALLLHVIEGFQGDPRENIRYLVLISYAAQQTGTDMRAAIHALSPLASPQATSCLEDFANRTDDQNRLQSMGITMEGAPGDIRFVPEAQ